MAKQNFRFINHQKKTARERERETNRDYNYMLLFDIFRDRINLILK